MFRVPSKLAPLKHEAGVKVHRTEQNISPDLAENQFKPIEPTQQSRKGPRLLQRAREPTPP